MKTFTRWLLALLLVATPMLVLVERASANTELVPASRLVAPYWDVNGSRATLFMLTNVSKSVDLKSVTGAVHVEFYDKSCDRLDTTIELSAGDVDQFDVKLEMGTAFTANNLGWADFDVRKGDGQREKDGLQCNVLLGEVVISDGSADWAIAYPMAASIGSSSVVPPTPEVACARTIVTHDLNGTATSWSGTYEPYPQRVFVPFFFAEDGPLGQKSQLVIAGPADGNYAGGSTGESPGQELPGSGTAKTLVNGTALFWDGCENKQSRSFGSHYINASLSDLSLLGPAAKQGFPWVTTAGLNCKNPANFPSVDSDSGSGAFIGWVDLPNILDTSAGDGETVRGMVGILLQHITTGKKEGDVVRLWGDPRVACSTTAPAGQCTTGTIPYTQVDQVSHIDLD